MALTEFQLRSLRYDLQELAHITYTDVLDELLDHYATLTEQRMATGLSFEEASKWAWAELGSGKGIRQIQTDYEKNILRQVKIQHLGILKSYFQWPILLSTVLVSLLVYLIVPLVPVKTLIICLLVLGCFPLILLGWGYFQSFDERIPAGKLIWKYMQHKAFLPINLFQVGLNLPNSFFENGRQLTRTFLQVHPTISVIICLLMLLYTISFNQLFRKKFYYQLA